MAMFLNVVHEFFILLISGLPKPTSVDQQVLIDLVLGFVQNFVPDFNASHITYVRSMKTSKFAVLNVQCKSIPIATRVKSTFASIVKSDNKPSYIKDVSISYAHTIGTRVRISLMRAMSKRQREKDQNAVCSVSAFTSRPLLRVGGKDQGTRFLSFVDAVAGFRHLLTQEDLDRALSLCSNQKGRLKSKFLVLSDDRVLPPYQRKKKPSGPGTNPNFDQISQAPNLHQPPPALPTQFQNSFLAASDHQQFPPLQFQAPSVASSTLIPGVAPIASNTAPQAFFQNQVLPGSALGYQHQMFHSQDQDPLLMSSPLTQLTVAPSQAQVHTLIPQSQVHQIHVQAQTPQAQAHQVLVQAQVHQSGASQAQVHQVIDPTFVSVGRSLMVDPPFITVGKKRGRKPAVSLGVKRQTPVRSAKLKEVKKVRTTDPLNKSENLEDFASCSEGGESENDITEATEAI